MKNNYSVIQDLALPWIYSIISKIRKKKKKGKEKNCYSLWVVETPWHSFIMMLASERGDKPVEFISLQPDPQSQTLLL